jgi:hypothetical protein
VTATPVIAGGIASPRVGGGWRRRILLRPLAIVAGLGLCFLVYLTLGGSPADSLTDPSWSAGSSAICSSPVSPSGWSL